MLRGGIKTQDKGLPGRVHSLARPFSKYPEHRKCAPSSLSPGPLPCLPVRRLCEPGGTREGFLGGNLSIVGVERRMPVLASHCEVNSN